MENIFRMICWLLMIQVQIKDKRCMQIKAKLFVALFMVTVVTMQDSNA